MQVNSSTCNKRSVHDDIDCPIDNNKRLKLDDLKTAVSETGSNKSSVVKNHNILINSKTEEKDENHEVEYLEAPVKLDIDYKDYRTIKLKNGLRALLISDDKTGVGSNSENNQEIHQFSTNILSEYGDNKSNDVQKKIFNHLQYAYCSLCINVGSFNDPINIQGLAHLLEHMISMGCKKYPKENEFDSFIQKRSGVYNAFTETEKTTFYFEIPEKYFLNALDRFANLFISPLLTKDAIVRECQAIENEFKLVKQLDISRVVQVKHSFLKHSNPASKFSWGNLKSLQDYTSIDKLYSELHRFHKRHYSAHRMTAVIQASRTLDELEKDIRNCFSDIPLYNGGLLSDDFSRFLWQDCFDSSKFKRIYSIKNVRDTSEIELNWVMPPMHHLYKSKPLEYIFHLLGQVGEGSLLHHLHKKMWCVDIHNGAVESFEHTSMYSLFSVSFDLTDEGYEHLFEILNFIFSYIKLLQIEGTSKSLYDHVKRIKEEDFRSCFENDYESFIKTVSQNMQHYAPVDYLNGYDLFLEDNLQAIQSCIDALSPENVNIIVSSKKINDKELDEVEPWFQTKYTSKEIPKEWIAQWKSIEPLPEFKLFIEENNIKNCFDQVNSFTEKFKPVKIVCVNGIELWHEKVSESHNSEFSIYLHLNIPESTESPLRAAMMHLLVIILHRLTKHYTTDKCICINVSVCGILLELIRFSEVSLLLLTTQILTDLKNIDKLLTKALFNQAKRELLKMYYNCFIDPCKLSMEVWLSISTSGYWISNEKYKALHDITYDQFISFTKEFPKKCFIQCLIKGNLNDDKSLNYIYEILSLLPCYVRLLRDKPAVKLYKYDLGERVCQVQNFNNADSNTIVTNYYQTGPSSVKMFVIFHLITEPLFNNLRTQEQLGYKISCAQYYACGVFCLSVSVITQANKFTAAYIDERITNFLTGFSHTLKAMPDEELIYAKENFIRLVYQHQQHNNSADSIWGEILFGQYIPNITEEGLEIVKDISTRDIYEHFIDYMIAGPNYRKLSVQVVGTPESMSIDNESNDSSPNKYSLSFSTEITNEKKRNSGYYVNDIRTYSQQLDVYP